MSSEVDAHAGTLADAYTPICDDVARRARVVTAANARDADDLTLLLDMLDLWPKDPP